MRAKAMYRCTSSYRVFGCRELPILGSFENSQIPPQQHQPSRGRHSTPIDGASMSANMAAPSANMAASGAASGPLALFGALCAARCAFALGVLSGRCSQVLPHDLPHVDDDNSGVISILKQGPSMTLYHCRLINFTNAFTKIHRPVFPSLRLRRLSSSYVQRSYPRLSGTGCWASCWRLA
eukprot:COSAG01_NODE_3866_length_5613_cov_6.609594_5_plen_180_part_00